MPGEPRLPGLGRSGRAARVCGTGLCSAGLCPFRSLARCFSSGAPGCAARPALFSPSGAGARSPAEEPPPGSLSVWELWMLPAFWGVLGGITVTPALSGTTLQDGGCAGFCGL